MSRDYLWRKMRTGHLIGFGTLFLVREEEALEEIRSMKRWDEYDQLCRNIGVSVISMIGVCVVFQILSSCNNDT